MTYIFGAELIMPNKALMPFFEIDSSAGMRVKFIGNGQSFTFGLHCGFFGRLKLFH